MKKGVILNMLIIISILSSVQLSAQTRVLDGKLGTGYATDPEKFGFQLDFAYLYELDPFFALGFEPAVFWASWERTLGTVELGATPVGADVKADTNAICIPLLAAAQIRLPNLEKKIHVLPFINVNLGYSMMIFQYAQPEYQSTSGPVSAKSDVDMFHGFTWQLMAGVAFDPGMNSKIKFIAELGYRGEKLKKDELEVDMSGFMFNIGIRFPLGG